MDLKPQDLKITAYDSSDEATKIESIIEKVKQKLISDVKASHRNVVDAFRAKISELERKLQDERATISILNQWLKKMTEEKNLIEVSFKLSEESNEQLQLNNNKLEMMINEKNSLIENLRLEVAQLNAERNDERAHIQDLSQPTLNCFGGVRDEPVTTALITNTPEKSILLPELESTLQERNKSCPEEGSQSSTSSGSISLSTIQTTRGEELEPESKNEYDYENGNKEVECQSKAPSLVSVDNFHQQQPDFYDYSDSEQEEEYSSECPSTEESTGSDGGESPPPFKLGMSTSSQCEPTGREHSEVAIGDKSRQLEETGMEQRVVEFHEEECVKEIVPELPILPSSSASSFHVVNGVESIDRPILRSPLKLHAESQSSSTTPRRKSSSFDYDCIPEKPFSPNRMDNNDKWDISTTSHSTKSSYEIQSPENRESNKSPIPSSSNTSPEKTNDIPDIDVNMSSQVSRKRTKSSTSSSPSSPNGTTKLRKASEEPPSPSNSNSSIPEDFRLLSDLYYRREEYPSISPGNACQENDLSGVSEESVLQVPEMYRVNYGFSNNFSMEVCPHARDFWYDSVHESSTKYFIRFFDDRDFGKWTTRRLTVKEQIGLAEPTVFQLKFGEIVQRLEENIQKPGGLRIWLDLRDFIIFFHSVSPFIKDFGPFITHFSFGSRLFSFNEISGDLLLEFIFKNLPNVEYLAFNDGSIQRLHVDLPPSVRDHSLQKLKTLRLISVASRFATPFIKAILLRAPVLSNVYGIPLHLLIQIEKQFFQKPASYVDFSCPVGHSSEISPQICMNSIKSVDVIRKMYREWNPSNVNQVVPYHIDIMTLFRLCSSLEELDTRIFFISSPTARKLCLEKLSILLQHRANSLKTLRMELLGDQESLTFSRLEKCETLQLEMRLKPGRNYRYFPRGMQLPDFFPSLNAVEIFLEDKSGLGTQNAVINSLKGQKAIDLFDAHFPSDTFHPLDTLATVQRLKLVNFTPLDLMDKFQKLFPYITILRLDQTLPVMTEILPECFLLWPKLKQLVLDVTFLSDMAKNLDSAFTGIPSATCKGLEKLEAKDVQFQINNINKYQNKPSISNLKELIILKIVLFHTRRGKSKMFPGCLMTPVSAIYGFGKERMPNLNVIIGLDDRLKSQERTAIVRHLEPMKPYLAIDE